MECSIKEHKSLWVRLCLFYCCINNKKVGGQSLPKILCVLDFSLLLLVWLVTCHNLHCGPCGTFLGIIEWLAKWDLVLSCDYNIFKENSVTLIIIVISKYELNEINKTILIFYQVFKQYYIKTMNIWIINFYDYFLYYISDY